MAQFDSVGGAKDAVCAMPAKNVPMGSRVPCRRQTGRACTAVCTAAKAQTQGRSFGSLCEEHYGTIAKQRRNATELVTMES